MKITNEQLCDLVVEVASAKFGASTFQRRPLMVAVERQVKERGWWTKEDDELSTSVGLKSVGLARIDWAISHLKERGRLQNVSHNKWKVP